jgi:hypothetical protein
MQAVKNQDLRIVQVRGRWRVEGNLAGRTAFITRVYVLSDESRLIPRVRYVDVFGEDTRTGASLRERILPGSHP